MGVRAALGRLFFTTRYSEDEWVDDPMLSMEDTIDTIREQAVVNRLLGGAHATLAHAIPILRACPSNPVRVLDGACGGADLTRRLVDAARRMGKPIDVIGLDMSTQVIACAREESIHYPEIHFVVADALHPPFQRGEFDIVLFSTFIHHLSPEQVMTLLRLARDLCRGLVIIADLARSPLAYLGFWFFAHLMRFNPVTIHDGLVSVRRAYTRRELNDMACEANLAQWKIYRHMISRMTLVYPGLSQERKTHE